MKMFFISRLSRQITKAMEPEMNWMAADLRPDIHLSSVWSQWAFQKEWGSRVVAVFAMHEIRFRS